MKDHASATAADELVSDSARNGVLGSHFDSRVFDLVESKAVEEPDSVVLTDTSGATMTARELWARITSLSSGLTDLGLPSGSRVAVMLDNCFDMVELYFAVPLAGHVFVPLNTGWRGRSLAFILGDCAPALLVRHRRYAAQTDQALAEADTQCPLYEVAELADCEGGAIPFLDVLRVPPVAGDLPGRDALPEDLLMLLYTSGTTGVSKGNMLTHRSCLWMAASAAATADYRRGEVVHSCLPLFHANALLCGLSGALLSDAVFALSGRFTASGFWEELALVGAHHTALLGSMVPLLLAAPERPAERSHEVRVAYCAPLPERVEVFERRFGLKCTSTYGLTDANILTCRPADDSNVQSCGWASPDWELRVVDDRGRTVVRGEVGELWARPKLPFISSLGYWNNAAATVALWSDLWVNTGDMLREDDEGRYHFVDRKKDAIRKGGENISSAEVEEVVSMFPAVSEAAVFAVPSALSEDEVMVVVTAVAGETVDPQRLFEHCVRELPFFSVPRYIEVVESIPRTENHRVRKAELREAGVREHTWDAGPVTRRRVQAMHEALTGTAGEAQSQR
jgi:carnitine-CoA ligase